VQGGFAFKSDDFLASGVPVLKIKNIRLRDVDVTDTEHVSQDVAAKAYRFYCKKGDILISMTGSGPQAPNSIVGRVARFTGPDDTYLINQRVGRFIIKDPRRLDPRFLFYVLIQQDIQWGLVSIATGSANQVNISGTQIESVRIPLPPSLTLQRAISHVLGALDDKIDLNRQMNQTLEAIAKTIFKRWFVDFNPNEGDLMAAADHDAFSQQLPPNSIESPSYSDMPKGWRIVGFADGTVFTFVSPGLNNPPAYTKYIATGDVQYSSVMNETHMKTSERPSRAQMQPGFGRVWFARMKNSPKFLWTMEEDNEWWSSRILSTGFAGIESSEPYYQAIAYCFVLSRFFEERKNSLATGTTMQALNNSTIQKIPVVIPNKEVAISFDRLVRPVFRKIWQNTFLNNSLAALRNTLLPKLVSGEITISQAERIVERHI
jgi:type I restriction enzyme S subunit